MRKGLLRDGEGKKCECIIVKARGITLNMKIGMKDSAEFWSPNFLKKNRGGKYRGRLTLNQPSDCVYKTSQACELDGNI